MTRSSHDGGAETTMATTAAEARAIAKEAYIYGFPIVDNLRIQHSYFVDQTSPEYKAPYNQLVNIPRVYTLEDTADGGLTLLIHHESPGKDNEANWLPAPQGPFSMIMRLYWPEAAALDGSWKAPPLKHVR